MSTKKKSVRKSEKKSHSKDNLLMENFVTLQKVLTNLVVRVDALTDQTSKLLSLFEISAKSFSQKGGASLSRDDKEFLQKLDRLIEQNKIIARSITMMDDKHKEQMPHSMVFNKGDVKPKPLPRP